MTDVVPIQYNSPKVEAARLNTTEGYLAKIRSTGTPAIPYIRFGKKALYDPLAVDAFLAKEERKIYQNNAIRNTSKEA